MLPPALFLGVLLTLSTAHAGPAEAAPVDTAPPPAEPAPAEPAPPIETVATVDPLLPDEPTEPAVPDEVLDPEDVESDDSDDDSDLLLWLAVIGLGIVAIACIAAIASSSSRRRRVRTVNHDVRNRQLAEVLSSSRWVHDQSITVMQIAEPVQLGSAWGQMRNQILDVERSVATMSSRPEMVGLALPMSELGSALAGVRGSLESYVTLASGVPASSDVIDNAMQTVQVRRRQLEAAISNAAAEARMTG